MTVASPPFGERAKAAACTAAAIAVFGYALVMGLAMPFSAATVDEALEVFRVAPPPPPPPAEKVKPRRDPSHRPEGAAAPPNIRPKATEIVAPKPVVVLPPPVPVVVAPVAGTGNEASQGAAPTPGPGTGAGGVGNGTGSGGQGYGDGGGGEETPPRRIKGRLKDSDYPRDAPETGASGTVTVRYFVEVDGRVTGCRVVASSGVPQLDETTCRLITERFRYDPSRDAAGRPVRSTMIVDHEWVLDR